MIYAKITILSVIMVKRSSYSDAKQWSVECVKSPKIKIIFLSKYLRNLLKINNSLAVCINKFYWNFDFLSSNYLFAFSLLITSIRIKSKVSCTNFSGLYKFCISFRLPAMENKLIEIIAKRIVIGYFLKNL